MKLKPFLIAILALIQITAMGQGLTKSAKKKLFMEAHRYMLAHNYASATPLLENLRKTDTLNANFNFMLGICYLKQPLLRSKSTACFLTASKQINPEYKEGTIKETGSHKRCTFYLAESYHYTYSFEKAIEIYNQYLSGLPENHPDRPLVLQSLEMCKSGIELVKDSIEIAITNLGPNVNSPGDEHTPVISADESMLIFTSRRIGSTGTQKTEEGKFFEDIYLTRRTKDGFTKALPISKNINTELHEATICLSPEGEELYIYRDDAGNGNIFVSRLIDNDWTVPEKLSETINTFYNETHLAISSENSTIIFVSDKPGGTGGKDLYTAQRLPNGEWGIPQNMGTDINTEFDEEGPFLHPDGTTLYFSSKGHNSMGGYDLFFSEKMEDGSWSKPVNLGYPINTTDDEVYYVLSPDGKRAYFSGVREDGYGGRDLYVMNLLSLPERSSVVIKGPIRVVGTKTIPTDILLTITDTETGKVIGKYKPNKDGNYLIILRQGKEYQLSCESKNCRLTPEIISVPDRTAFKEIHKPISLDPISNVRY